MSRVLVIGCGGVASVANSEVLSGRYCIYRTVYSKQDKRKM